MSGGQLFEPIKVGNMKLGHRVAMAPLTRRRADENGVPSEYAAEYYKQRAQYPGTLIISEATVVSPEAAPRVSLPLFHTEKHRTEWKKIVNAIHSQKSFVFHQLYANGNAPSMPAAILATATKYPVDHGKRLRELTINELSQEDIENYIKWFADAAYLSVHEVGFDGVELHGANGYLLEQFLRESTNQRTDEYGGSVENRTLFHRKLIAAIVDKVGDQAKVALRISPWSRSGKAQPSETTVAEYASLLAFLQRDYPSLAYVSVVEPRLANGHADDAAVPYIEGLDLNEWNLFIRIIWRGIIMRAGGLVDDAKQLAAKDPKVLIAFGRYYISNPDIVDRLRNGKELTKYYRPTFYSPGPEGYVDYPNAS